MIVILDNIRSVYNVGSIFRTSDALAVEKIILCGITPGPKNDFGFKRQDLHKVALGAEESVPSEHKKNTAFLIRKLKQNNYTIFALEQHKASISCFSLEKNDINWNRSALVLGAEPDGIKNNILAQCDKILELPMKGEKESLNVSAAFAAALYHIAYASGHIS